MKDNKYIQSFNEHENLNKVTEKGQRFKVNLPTQIMRGSKFWKENKIYTCTDIIKFDGLDSEIYVGDNWISDSFTSVVIDIK